MLYARIVDDKGKTRKQTLSKHSKNAAKVAAHTCAFAGLENLGRLAGLTHDCEKAYRLWQDYLEYGGRVIFHAPYAVEFIDRTFGGINIPFAGITRQLLGMAVRAHHGGLHDALTPSGEKNLPAASEYSPEEKAAADEAFFSEVVSRDELLRLFAEACKEVEQQLRRSIALAKEPTAAPPDADARRNEAMFYLGMSQRMLYSALIDADRLDAACCEAGEKIPKETRPDIDEMLRSLENRLNSFEKTDIGKLRGDISEMCWNFDVACGIYRLFVPTGGGKTLSSLRLALSIAKKYGKRRIFFIEPYLTILSQAAKEIRDAIGEENEEKGVESNVLEFHSNVVFEDDDDGREQENRYSKLSERLDKFIVLTSTVQFLNALFSGKSANARRMSALAGSVIIIDETQAIPTASTYLFSLAMNYLSRFCGCLIVLCTATPPALENIKYPVRMPEKPDIVGNTQELFAAFKRTSLKTFPGEKFSAERLSAFVIEKLEKNGNCLVIVNTKAAAKKLYAMISTALEGKYKAFFLSTALCPAHREEKLKKIRELLPDGRVLVVSTQLIEAGVDISFKCVIRSMAGLDSIIQASGRCNRHKELDVGRVYAVDFEEENLSKLKDIKEGKRISCALAALFPNADLSAPDMVRRYYEEYFYGKSARLDYTVDGAYSATALLGNNQTARAEYGEKYGQGYPSDMLAQSFRSVGKVYSPIDTDTTGVVVPYGDSAMILDKFKASRGRERQSYARQLQHFSVNVFDNQLQRLRDAGTISYDGVAELWVLEKGAYDDTGGIDTGYEDSVDKYIL